MNYYLEVWKRYAQFSGRTSRPGYWYFFLFNVLIGIVLIVLDNSQTVYNIYSLAILIPSIAVGVRRMHDVGKSGWYLIIPIYNLILAATAGQEGPNEYGPDPKGGVDADTLDAEMVSGTEEEGV